MNNDELKRQILLMNYNNKKTLTENIDEILSEQGVIKDLVSTGSIVARELEGVLKTMMKDSKVAKDLKNVEIYKGGVKTGVRTAEELINAIKLNKLSSSLKGELELAILRSKTTNRTLIDSAASNLARNQKFINKYTAEIRQGQSQYEAALKRAGYSDEAITSIVQQTESLGGKIKTAEEIGKDLGKDLGKDSKDLGKDLGKDSKDLGKDLGKDLDKSGQNIIDDVLKNPTKPKRYWRTKFKKWGWIDEAGKLTSKGRRRIVQVLGAAALIWWLKSDNDDEKIPKPIPEPIPKPIPVVDPNPIVNPTYTNCTDFPYKKGCQSPIIAEVQKCLGLTNDGKFGPNTEQKLKSLGYGVEITKEVYDKIKLNCGSSTNTITTPTTTLSYDQQYGISPNPNQAETGSGYETISMDDFN